jgi:glycosyltransferase involved in cell wall biosynthesis
MSSANGLRFCMVTTFYPPYNFGGDGMGIQRFSQALVRGGHHVTVLQDIDAFNSLRTGAEPVVERESDGVEVIRLRSGIGALSLLLTQQIGRPVIQGRKIRRILAQGNFDVINFHNVSLVGGPGILSAGNALKLYMAHEHWLVCPSHVLWRHDREACTGRECLRCVLHYKRPPQLWRYTGYLERQLKRVDAFIAMSEFSRDKHYELGFPREMEVVNYFIPRLAPRNAPAETSSPHPRPYFLFVGRLEKIKGLDDVIPIFRSYQNADLIIAGDGTHASVLKGLAEGIPNVRFLGRLQPHELDRYYRHAQALIVPSAGFETFGIILIESFRQGTPVIARRIGPFPEIVRRAGGGELFSGPEDLMDAMRRIQSDPGYRQQLASSAAESFVKYWSEDAIIPQYLAVVGKAAAAKGRNDLVKKIEMAGVA